jgi:hypothetical protein
MKVTILPCPEKDAKATAPVCISAVVVYEGVACGSRAKAALDRVMARLAFDGVCSLDLWPFELLDYPLLKREAAESAARSDVIVLALRGDRPMPPAVRSWIELWRS